jgi:hypothetical protein
MGYIRIDLTVAAGSCGTSSPPPPPRREERNPAAFSIVRLA